MKSKIMTFALLIMVTFGVLSCSKDDDSNNSISNAYVYGDDKVAIKWAGYNYYEDYGYAFTLMPTVPNSQTNWSDTDYFHVEVPVEKMGEKCYLNEDNIGQHWGLYLYFMHKGVEYRINSTSDVDRNDDVTGTNNWIKVTKNGTTGSNFTIEYEIMVKGKLLKGSYTGNFEPNTFVS
jgi:hypothetical protein